MMLTALTPMQRWIAFIILCLATIIAIASECYFLFLLGQDVIAGKKPEWVRCVSTLLGAGVSGLLGQRVRLAYKDGNSYEPIRSLRSPSISLFLKRVRTIENAQQGQNDGVFDSPKCL
jgi:hypothetical protein